MDVPELLTLTEVGSSTLHHKTQLNMILDTELVF